MEFPVFLRLRNYLLSSSEDGTVRLWSLQTYTCLVGYKGHNYPVWDTQFSPFGYYFVSGGHDRVARCVADLFFSKLILPILCGNFV